MHAASPQKEFKGDTATAIECYGRVWRRPESNISNHYATQNLYLQNILLGSRSKERPRETVSELSRKKPLLVAIVCWRVLRDLSVLLLRLPRKTTIWSHCLTKRVERVLKKIRDNHFLCQLSVKPKANVSCQLNFRLFVSCQLKFCDVTRDDSQRRYLAQHSVAMVEQCWKHSKQCRNNVVTLRCAKKRRCESSRVTSPLELLHLYTAVFNFSVAT